MAKYKTETVIGAIKASGGLVYVAARALGCSHQTIYNYAKKYPTVQEAIDEQRGFTLDLAEQALLKAVQGGEGWAVCFLLKTLGKERGFVERQELTGAEGQPLLILDK